MQQAIELINQLLATKNLSVSDSAIITNINSHYFQVVDGDKGIEISTINQFSREAADYILVGYKADIFTLPKTVKTMPENIILAKKENEGFNSAHETFTKIVDLINI